MEAGQRAGLFPLISVESFVGIEIGGTKLQLVVGDAQGKISARQKLAVQPGKGAAGIREQIASSLPKLVKDYDVKAIGVGFGGPVDWRTGKICRSHQIEGWSEFDLASWLQNIAQISTYIDNDANLAALGEAKQGSGVGFSPVFYVTLGSGVGGGLVVGGSIYHGAMPGEAEIGHLRLDRKGTTVESQCSGWAVDAKIRGIVAEEPNGVLAKLIGTQNSGGEAAHLPAALEQKDRTATHLLEEIAEDLAFGLSHVVHLFHPEIIVLGGGLSKIGEPLRLRVENAMRDFTMKAFAADASVALAKLGEDAVPTGALLLAGTSERRR